MLTTLVLSLLMSAEVNQVQATVTRCTKWTSATETVTVCSKRVDVQTPSRKGK